MGKSFSKPFEEAYRLFQTIRYDMDSYSSPRRYPMKNNPRGLAVIWYFTDFDSKTLKPLHGYTADKDNLQEVFDELKFTTIVEHNLTTAKAKNCLKQYVKDANDDDFDAFVFCVMSHGGGTSFCTKDGEMFPDDLATAFECEKDKCPKLARKPKMFFIQACRGNKHDKVPDMCNSTAPEEKPYVYPTALKADFLMVFASPPGYATIVCEKTGSFFVQALVKILKLYATGDHKESFNTALLDMTRMVVEGTERRLKILGKDPQSIKQVPWMSSTLTARVYFPPLSEVSPPQAQVGLGGLKCSECGGGLICSHCEHQKVTKDIGSDAPGDVASTSGVGASELVGVSTPVEDLHEA